MEIECDKYKEEIKENEKNTETDIKDIVTINNDKPEIMQKTAEVYRKKGTTNINERLNKEIEMNDSYLNFKKLMNEYEKKCTKTKKTINSNKLPIKKQSDTKLIKINNNLSNKYKDSLWFSQQPSLAKKKKNKKIEKIENKHDKRKKRFNKSSFPSCTHFQLPVLEKISKKKGGKSIFYPYKYYSYMIKNFYSLYFFN